MKRTYVILSVFATILAFEACKTQQIKKSNSAIEKEATKKNNGVFVPNTALSYINTYRDIAIKEMNENGIPASITLAQGILESNFGNSDLAKYANNHFGIKCTSTWTGKGYYKDDDQENDCFRVYKDAEESYKDHSEFLKRKRYAGLFQLDKNDYKGWAKGLKEAGYATNPNYSNLIISTIEKYDLAQFDQSDSEKSKIARQDKIFGDINAEMAQEDAKYTPVNKAPKGTVTTEEAEARIEKEAPKTLNEEAPTEIPAENTAKNDERVVYKSSTPKQENSTDTTPTTTSENTYTVQPGDGLYRVARMFSLSVDRIKEINHLNSDEIQAGQVLIVKDDGSVTTRPIENKPDSTTVNTTPKTADRNIPIAESAPKEEINPASNNENEEVAEIETTTTYYTVQAGDSFYKIAKDFNATVEQIKAYNPSIGDNLQVGQEIIVTQTKKNIYKETPPKKAATATKTETSTTTSSSYTVQKGDSLYKIAKQFNLTIDELKSLNNITTDSVQVGQVLKISKQ